MVINNTTNQWTINYFNEETNNYTNLLFKGNFENYNHFSDIQLDELYIGIFKYYSNKRNNKD